jgi:hypothetical protein
VTWNIGWDLDFFNPLDAVIFYVNGTDEERYKGFVKGLQEFFTKAVVDGIEEPSTEEPSTGTKKKLSYFPHKRFDAVYVVYNEETETIERHDSLVPAMRDITIRVSPIRGLLQEVSEPAARVNGRPVSSTTMLLASAPMECLSEWKKTQKESDVLLWQPLWQQEAAVRCVSEFLRENMSAAGGFLRMIADREGSMVKDTEGSNGEVSNGEGVRPGGKIAK